MLSKRSGLTRGFRSAASRILHGLLLVLACQIPLPWCHCHGTLTGALGENTPWLGTHLRTHHPALASLPGGTPRWHWHLDFARLPGHSPEQRLPDDQDRLPGSGAVELLVQVITGAASDAATHGVVDFRTAADPLREGAEVRSAPAHFFGAAAPTVSLSRRYCVARC